MITPTAGRVVWVQRRHGSIDPAQPETATIVYVHSDTVITVRGWDANGQPFVLTSLTLDQGQDIPADWPRAEWMPYQKGQAAKTEALEAAAKSSSSDERLA